MISDGTDQSAAAKSTVAIQAVNDAPLLDNGGIAGFIFRAWDQTTVAGARERVDTSITGGTSAFSVDTESVSIDILAVNDPPIVDLNGPLPGSAFAASFLSSNQPASLSAPDAFIEDVESVQIVSLIVTLKKNGSQESLTASETRSGIRTTHYNPTSGAIRFDGLAAVEDYSAILQSLSYSNSASVMNTDPRVIEFVANDGSDNSLASQATLSPLLSNSAPILDPDTSTAFASILEDDVIQIGDAIYDLLATAKTYPIHDSDADPRRGFAIVGAENQGGVWHFTANSSSPPDPAALLSDWARMVITPQTKRSP